MMNPHLVAFLFYLSLAVGSFAFYVIQWYVGVLVNSWYKQRPLRAGDLSLTDKLKSNQYDLPPIVMSWFLCIGIVIYPLMLLWTLGKIPYKLIYMACNNTDNPFSNGRLAKKFNNLLIKDKSNLKYYE